jgi:lambda family phage tail tape measure protein
MATAPQIGIVLTGDASQLIAAANAAQKAMADMSGKTVQQMQKDSAQVQKDMRRSQWQSFQLYQQIQDVGLQIAGGQNPLLALAQQGSQLTAIYGSVGAALRAAGGAVAAVFLNPVGLAAAALAGLGYAAYEADRQSAELRKSLYLTGNAAGMTQEKFNALVTTIAETTDTGAGKVREFAQAMVRSGRFGAQGFEEMTKLAINMASATGQSVEATVQTLIRLKDAPAQWAAEQNKQLRFLSDAQLQYVQRLEAFGQREKAAQVVREELLKRFPKVAEENLGSLEKLTKNVGNWFSDMWAKVLNVGREKTLTEKIADLKAELEVMKNPNAFTDAVTDSRNRKKIPLVEGQIANMQLQQAAEIAKAEAASVKVKTEDEKTANRLYQERIAPLKEALDLVMAESKTKAIIRGIDEDLVRLKQDAAGYDNPEIQAYYAKQLAAKELLKIEQQRKLILQEINLNAAKPSNTPEQENAKKIRGIDLSDQLKDNQLQRLERELQLRADLNKLAQEKITLGYALEELRNKEMDAIEANKRASMLRGNEMRDQLKASQYVIPEQGQRFLARQDIDAKEAAALGEISNSKVLNLLEKEAAVKDTINMYNKERNALEEKYSDLIDRNYNGQRGVNDALRDYAVESAQAGRAAYQATMQVVNILEDSLTNAVIKGKLDFKSLTDFIIAEVVRMKIIKPMLTDILNLGGSGGESGGGFADIMKMFFANANGNAFGPSGVIPFAKGGVVTRPTLFPFAKGTGLMGEAGPEAIMPLGRDNQGRLGVRGGGSNVQVNIINNAGAQVSQTQRQQGDTTLIDVLITQVEDRIAGNVAAGSGSMFHSIGNTFGIKRGIS